uniref:Uncharacterized protein n=1 Tax=Sphaerodactylus townsendi TaxID=933632 RepID=A0ACB8EV54_9SAUR
MAGQLRYPGKVVIVTRGTAGIGLAIVREFVRQGANVVFCSIPSEAEKGQAIQRELQNSGCPGDAYFEVCDVRKETDIKRLISATLERYGCLDCLVNNAGGSKIDKIDDVTAQDARNAMEFNTLSILLASKYALPYLRETRGNIINLASIAGMIGAKDRMSYSPCKGAIIAMTKTLAIDESKYGVRVNWKSCPTQIQHLRPHDLISHELSVEVNIYPSSLELLQLLGRLGTPEEVALAALYLAADGTFCTGFNLVVSGGAEIGFGKKAQVDSEPGSGAGGNSQDSSRK